MQWHVALAQPGKDRVASDALKNQCYEVYRPIFPTLVHHGRGRMRSVIKSMFPSYIFVRDRTGEGWHWLRNCQGVRVGSCLLMINGRLAVVDNAIIDEVRAEEKRLCTVDVRGQKLTIPYKIGERVRIHDGPLCGLFGEVSKLDDTGRVCLLMKILGRDSRVWTRHEHLAAI